MERVEGQTQREVEASLAALEVAARVVVLLLGGLLPYMTRGWILWLPSMAWEGLEEALWWSVGPLEGQKAQKSLLLAVLRLPRASPAANGQQRRRCRCPGR